MTIYIVIFNCTEDLKMKAANLAQKVHCLQNYLSYQSRSGQMIFHSNQDCDRKVFIPTFELQPGQKVQV